MTVPTAIEVGLLDASAGEDPRVVKRLTELINEVYATAEEGLWRDGATRTTPSQVAGLVRAREIAVATVSGELVGAVRVWAVSEVTGETGMLVADPERRNIGVGSALIAFAEGRGRELGLRTMQLELLVPRGWQHPTKVFLDEWYRRIGYRVTRTTGVAESEPELAPLLAVPCEFVVYEKSLD